NCEYFNSPSRISGLKNDNLLRAGTWLNRVTVSGLVMRQAGRYLPEFQGSSQTTMDFLLLVACEVYYAAFKKIDLDASIIFSDILEFPSFGSLFPETLTNSCAFIKLTPKSVSRLTYWKAITMMRHKLEGKVPLIGFTGPWHAYGHMIEVTYVAKVQDIPRPNKPNWVMKLLVSIDGLILKRPTPEEILELTTTMVRKFGKNSFI
ncbi:Uroporphyrinogen decarboxylase, partial [Lucilia cuprina]